MTLAPGVRAMNRIRATTGMQLLLRRLLERPAAVKPALAAERRGHEEASVISVLRRKVR